MDERTSGKSKTKTDVAASVLCIVAIIFNCFGYGLYMIASLIQKNLTRDWLSIVILAIFSVMIELTLLRHFAFFRKNQRDVFLIIAIGMGIAIQIWNAVRFFRTPYMEKEYIIYTAIYITLYVWIVVNIFAKASGKFISFVPVCLLLCILIYRDINNVPSIVDFYFYNFGTVITKLWGVGQVMFLIAGPMKWVALFIHLIGRRKCSEIN